MKRQENKGAEDKVVCMLFLSGRGGGLVKTKKKERSKEETKKKDEGVSKRRKGSVRGE